MSTKPLADVDTHFQECHNCGTGLYCLRYVSMLDAAHERAVSQLRAQLAMARAELVSIHGGRTVHDIEPKPDCPLCRAIQAIDEPGQWVPAERLKECQAVLADLREERGDEYRKRVETALKMLNEGMPAGNQVVRDVLEGRWPERSAREPTPYGFGYVEYEEHDE